MEYIHYGSTNFIKEKFEEISQIAFFSKPFGGFWASRVGAEYGWKEWIANNNFRVDRYREDNCFKFKLKEGTKVLTINNAKQLYNLPKNTNGYRFTFSDIVYLDFEKLAKEYDAIEVLISEDKKLYWNLYGWDCDSILIMNKDVVEVI